VVGQLFLKEGAKVSGFLNRLIVRCSRPGQMVGIATK